MELPTLTAWNAGVEHDEDLFNELTYALDFLLAPPECHVTQTAAQSIANGTTTATAITFDTEYKDNDGMYDAATPTYITIQTPGWYEIEYAVSWATKSSDTTIRALGLYLNGALAVSAAIGYADYINDSGTTPQLWQSYDLFLNEADKLYLGVVQGSGSSLSTASHATLADRQTFLRVRWASL